MINHCGTKTIEFIRLMLRRFEYIDNRQILKNWLSDYETQSLISEPIYTTITKIDELLNKWIGSYQQSDYYRWVIEDKSTNVCIGQIAIFMVDNKNRFCEIEYAIGCKFRCKGYAAETVGLILYFAFNTLHMHKVQVCHKEGNIASQRVLLKNNFTNEGTLCDYFFMDGKYVSRLYYSMLEEEYKNSNRCQVYGKL